VQPARQTDSTRRSTAEDGRLQDGRQQPLDGQQGAEDVADERL